MKYIKITALIAIISFFISCDDKEWPQSSVEEVDIYSLSEINGGPYAIEIYKDSPIMIEFANQFVASKFEMENFSAVKSDSAMDISYSIQREDMDTMYTYLYDVHKAHTDSVAELTIGKIETSGDTTISTHSSILTNEKRWN